MDERRLGVFVAVARCLSFSRAADLLHLSQPAVSHHIAALEEDLGTPLFERARHRVTLTPAGLALLPKATAIVGDMAEARRVAAAAASTITGSLTVGASRTIGEYLLPAVFTHFCSLYPRVHVHATFDNTKQVVSRLVEGALDIGFVEGAVEVSGVTLRAFQQDELVVVAPAGHRWAALTEVPLPDFLEEPIVLREKGSGTRQVMETQLCRAGIDPRRLRSTIEEDGTEAIKAAVEAGLGVAVLSQLTLRKELLLGTLIVRRLEGVPMFRDLCEVVVSGRVVAPAAAALSMLVRASGATQPMVGRNPSSTAPSSGIT